ESFLGDRSGGGAVAALHVVCVDLQAGLAVYLRLGREQQVLVFLVGVRLYRARPNEDGTTKDGASPLIQDAIVVEPAGVVRLRVVDGQVVVDVLAARGDVQAEQAAVRARSVHQDTEVVAGQRGAGGEGGRAEAAIARLPHARHAHVVGAAVKQDSVMLSLRSVLKGYLSDGVVEVNPVQGEVGLNH